MWENVSKFKKHFIKEPGTTNHTYLQDTPDFLRHIEEINQSEDLENALLVMLNVVGLFTNIPEEDGIDSVRNIVEDNKITEMNTKFLLRLLQLILENNIVEFDTEYCKQEIGAPMGQRQVPPYANIFMSQNIDPQIIERAKLYMKSGKSSLQFLKRFLDDLFSIWKGTSKDLHRF